MRQIIRELLDDQGKVEADVLVGEWLHNQVGPPRVFETVEGKLVFIYEHEIASDEEV